MTYLAGPLTAGHGHSLLENIQAATDVYFDLIAAGKIAFCPHLGALSSRAFEIDYERWMACDFAIIDLCDTVLMLDRWETSSGAVREREYALLMGKRVVYDVGELL